VAYQATQGGICFSPLPFGKGTEGKGLARQAVNKVASRRSHYTEHYYLFMYGCDQALSVQAGHGLRFRPGTSFTLLRTYSMPACSWANVFVSFIEYTE